MTPTSLSTRDAGWIIFILALGAGFSVASIYYAQPLLPLMGANLHLTVEGMGLVPTLTQAGYALGILFLLPLGDRHDRRRLILVKSALLALLLLLCSLTGQLSSLLVVSLLIGMAATMAQDIVPAAAILAPAGKQGKMVGTVMTGLLLGILLSRTVSGVVGAVFGWRVMYQTAAVSVALIGLVMWRVLPRFAVHSTLSYPQLMASMAHLWQRYPALRRAALAQGALSIAFSAFWSTLAVMLSEHYHMGSAVAGGFGIAGAAGALAALADEPGYAQINTADAARLGIEDEALVWVNSRKGRIITRAQVSNRPNKGAVYMTYQWWIGACNELVAENLSPITKTPEYKYCAVNVERIADQRAAEQYVIDEYTKLKASLRESAMG